SDQVLGNARQLTVGGLAGLGFAWHTCSLATCYALNTKFLTGPLSVEQLHWLLDGIDISAIQRHPPRHYQRAV
ncbi:hypothetical protein VSR17_30705, partial [Cupriavidus taiwanensis]